MITRKFQKLLRPGEPFQLDETDWPLFESAGLQRAFFDKIDRREHPSLTIGGTFRVRFALGDETCSIEVLLVEGQDCTDCRGSGRIELFTSAGPCDACHGRGLVAPRKASEFNSVTLQPNLLDVAGVYADMERFRQQQITKWCNLVGIPARLLSEPLSTTHDPLPTARQGVTKSEKPAFTHLPFSG